MATVTASSLAISASGPAISPHTGRNHCAGHRATSASFMNSELFARSATLSPHAAVVSRPVESRRPSVFTVCKISVGDVVPPIGLKDQDGKLVNLDKFRGKNLVLYFYPADFTPTCTKQACAFRDSYEKFKKAGAEVVGVSADSPELHKQFKARYRLPFTLLSDEGNKLRKDWAVPGDVFGTVPGRITYVIDKNGKVVLIYNNAFDAQKHIDETLNILQS
ncbi:peroxiredoxin Q, chloroplastic [Physcomitrium patens]|nr:peroxiredoxin Q, chloroplastic-like [Physcomitrium patens]|eukprot:XP_024400459.1 peroxiredoxin Q, chloroplastic-like [Physcomitrella patens]